MSSILSIDRISKFYGPIKALNNVSFEVPEGSVFGILGPNGSGKTTLLGIIMNVLNATNGSFSWMGHPGGTAEIRRKIGTLLETPNFYAYLSGQKNLEIAAAIKGHGQDDIARVLQVVNLYQRKDSKFSTYSLGMKQRLAIASTLLGNPKILVFDEPTNGLDPAGIAEIRQLIKDLSSQGKTIIMASHILDEVEKVCTHVAIIQKGELKTVGSVGEVLSGSTDNSVIIEVAADNLSMLQEIIRTYEGVQNVTVNGNILQVQCADSVNSSSLNDFCFSKGITLSMLNPKRKNLEARFLEITGNQSDR